MHTLAAAEYLAGVADVASKVNIIVMGFELNTSTNAEAYKTLYRGQLPSSATSLYPAPTGNSSLIKYISLVNTDSSARTFNLYINGTTDPFSITGTKTLQAGCSAEWTSEGGWKFTDRNGQAAQSVGQAPLLPNFGPSGCLAETFPRTFLDETNVSLLASGRLSLQAIWLQAGTVITSITFYSATTAAGTPTNQRFALYDSNRNLLAQTNDDTTTAWAANTGKTLNLTSQYTVPSTGLYYLGIMVAATTVPTIKGMAAPSASQIHGLAPIINGTSTTGLTTTLPNPAAAITVTTTSAYAHVN